MYLRHPAGRIAGEEIFNKLTIIFAAWLGPFSLPVPMAL
jgi:hypothetical protein